MIFVKSLSLEKKSDIMVHCKFSEVKTLRSNARELSYIIKYQNNMEYVVYLCITFPVMSLELRDMCLEYIFVIGT